MGVGDTTPELFDTFNLPRFEPSGIVKTAKEAIAETEWMASINIWLYTIDPVPSMIYQIRDYNSVWMPGKLDCAAAGYYTAGESGLDGLRELREELGIDIPKHNIHYFGRKLNVAFDEKGRERHWIISVYDAEYKGSLRDMKLQEEELEGVVAVPLVDLIAILKGQQRAVAAAGFAPNGSEIQLEVTADNIPYNFDDYHLKMAEFLALKAGVSDAYLRD